MFPIATSRHTYLLLMRSLLLLLLLLLYIHIYSISYAYLKSAKRILIVTPPCKINYFCSIYPPFGLIISLTIATPHSILSQKPKSFAG